MVLSLQNNWSIAKDWHRRQRYDASTFIVGLERIIEIKRVKVGAEKVPWHFGCTLDDKNIFPGYSLA